jgi:hypothetical protein
LAGIALSIDLANAQQESAQPSTPGSAKPAEERGKDRRGANKKADEPRPAETPYTTEFSMNVDYNVAQGAVKSADPDGTDAKFSETKIGVAFFTGWLVSDHLEPILEVKYSVLTQKVDTFESKQSLIDIGFGMLVNLPQVSDDRPARDQAGNAVPEIMRANWVPFFGFLIGNSRATGTQGLPADSGVLNDSGTFTKLVAGTRWMIYPHISLNLMIKALYENSTSTAESGDKLGASRSKLKVDMHLLSMSLFF